MFFSDKIGSNSHAHQFFVYIIIRLVTIISNLIKI